MKAANQQRLLPLDLCLFGLDMKGGILALAISHATAGPDTPTQCCRKCKILARRTDHLWLMVGWSVSVLGSPPVNNLLRPCSESKNGQNGPNGIRILLRRSWHLISVHLWNRLSTFITKHFLQNLKNPLVAKRTIYGRTLGRPVDWWVAFGDRATVFQQHCLLMS